MLKNDIVDGLCAKAFSRNFGALCDLSKQSPHHDGAGQAPLIHRHLGPKRNRYGSNAAVVVVRRIWRRKDSPETTMTNAEDPEEAGLAPSWPAGVARDGKDEERMKKRPQRRRVGVYWLGVEKAK
jgi:hypothetical protein